MPGYQGTGGAARHRERMPRFSCPAICSEIRQARPAMANHQQYSSISKAILIGESFNLNRISFSEGKCGLRAVNWSLPHWSLPAQLHPAGHVKVALILSALRELRFLEEFCSKFRTEQAVLLNRSHVTHSPEEYRKSQMTWTTFRAHHLDPVFLRQKYGVKPAASLQESHIIFF